MSIARPNKKQKVSEVPDTKVRIKIFDLLCMANIRNQTIWSRLPRDMHREIEYQFLEKYKKPPKNKELLYKNTIELLTSMGLMVLSDQYKTDVIKKMHKKVRNLANFRLCVTECTKEDKGKSLILVYTTPNDNDSYQKNKLFEEVCNLYDYKISIKVGENEIAYFEAQTNIEGVKESYKLYSPYEFVDFITVTYPKSLKITYFGKNENKQETQQSNNNSSYMQNKK